MYLPKEPFNLDAMGIKDNFLVIETFGLSFSQFKLGINQVVCIFFLSDLWRGESFQSFQV